ncbi:hypothetical protein MUB24_15970 [Lederbergia sp. NSJ-179]|uniref:hypothetical protein n=1 Tax=Lederbergia sp. NSJ-179 TaxID=2931402 RepID=UPI001FCF9A2D|nr:hypothetical protein [Lederbergia sp. NSJ-179]MCJ7842366.1 hypothetical protein [Lederbergia sp. NSJ-179]
MEDKKEVHPPVEPTSQLPDRTTELLQEVKALRETVKKLETDIEDIKYFTPEPPRRILDKEVIGTVGGLF